MGWLYICIAIFLEGSREEVQVGRGISKDNRISGPLDPGRQAGFCEALLCLRDPNS